MPGFARDDRSHRSHLTSASQSNLAARELSLTPKPYTLELYAVQALLVNCLEAAFGSQRLLRSHSGIWIEGVLPALSSNLGAADESADVQFICLHLLCNLAPAMLRLEDGDDDTGDCIILHILLSFILSPYTILYYILYYISYRIISKYIIIYITILYTILYPWASPKAALERDLRPMDDADCKRELLWHSIVSLLRNAYT